jgi:hypothetical protein
MRTKKPRAAKEEHPTGATCSWLERMCTGWQQREPAERGE